MLADSYNMLAYYHFADPYEMRKRSSEAATKALSLDDNIAETYIALAFLKMNENGGMDAAKELLEKAIAIAPYNSTAHVRYGWLLLNSRGDLNATAEQMRLAQQYDPASGVSNGALCDVLSFQGKFDEAIKHCEKAVEINPELDAAQMALAEVYFAGGRRDDAMKLAEKVVAKSQGSDRLSMLGSLGYFNAKLGNKDRAREIIAEIKPSAAQMPFLLNDLVVINYALGNTDEGFNYFQQLMDKSFIPFRFYYDPLWADVRADSRTVGLAKKRMAGM
jgi:tetratricopeptide (TPR) repeat protein